MAGKETVDGLDPEQWQDDEPEDEDDDQDDGDWIEYDEDGDATSDCICLFCNVKYQSPEMAFGHCKDVHNFDLGVMHGVFHLDCFSFIKMINYIRLKHPDVDQLSVPAANGRPLWDSEVYLKPVLEDDGLLQFDIESMSISHQPQGHLPNDTSSINAGAAAAAIDDGFDPGSQQQLMQQLRDAELRASQAEERLQQAVTDLTSMRDIVQKMMLSQTAMGSLPSSDQAIQHLKDDEDGVYFSSYDHHGIHQEMLQDHVRTESYRDAIYNNREMFRDKVVLDVGCGTGILSMFAATAGAKQVIGVDMSDIIYQAMDIVRENGFESKIKLVKGRMEEVDLPVKKVDIIISEWMGYFLLFESMLDTVLWARDHCLVDGGIILPNHCTMRLVAMADLDLRQRNYTFWEEVYGFKMTCMQGSVMKEAMVTVTNSNKLLTDPCVIKELDINKCQTKDLEFSSAFKLTALRAGKVTALVAYFDVDFSSCPNKISFSTGPEKSPTHWKQTVFLLQEPVSLIQGHALEGQLSCRKNPRDPRSLLVTITIEGNAQTYIM